MGCFQSKREEEHEEKSNEFRRVAKYGRLSCWYTNATSLKNKLDLLKSKNNDYDVLMVTETWLNASVDVLVEGYTCFRQDRSTGKQGGGVCIFVRYCFEARAIEKPPKEFISQEVEQIWCRVKVDSKRILLGCIYRPPRANKQASEAINDSMKCAWKMLKKRKIDRLLICGDFNYPNLNWSPTDSKKKKQLEPTMMQKSNATPSEAEFKNLVEKLEAIQNVTEKTFQRAGEKKGDRSNTLDLVITEKPRRCRKMRYEQPLGEVKQGHMQISWEYKFKNRGFLRKLFFCVSN